MFQFPGFALKPLCIQGKSTWLCSLMSAPRSPSKRTPRSNNNKHSGGFPHSDIHGSKPVPGSPWLNAGYHVLHRLLLPRHPPNALFALDLIQKEQGWFNLPLWRRLPLEEDRLSQLQKQTDMSKACILTHCRNPKVTTVSVLDLETISFLTRRSETPSRGYPKRY
jgi:hypothetical protein